ncbi:MAG: hypothetical protein ACYC6N_27790 [Pirellulaceae bacterium]
MRSICCVRFAGVLVACAFGSDLGADLPINPVPRAVKTTTLHTWDFDDGTSGWVAENQCSLSSDGGVLRVQSMGNDPFMHCPVDFPGGQMVVQLRVRSDANEPGQVFWTTDKLPHRSEAQRTGFAIEGDGQWHETQARFPAPGRLTDLRIDPSINPGTVEIDSIRLIHEELHPLSVTAVEQGADKVRFLVTNHRDEPITFDCLGATHTAAGQETVTMEQAVQGTQPLESTSLTVNCESWPPLVRTVWVAHPAATGEWIEKPLDEFVLKVARSGHMAAIYRDTQLVAFLGPLVLCDGKLPGLQLVCEGPTLQFEGDGVQVSLTPQGREIAIQIRSQQTCEGPVVRVTGALQQGLFAGLEYLGKGECSSSRLDIETDEHIRFAPDPLKVTLPLMTFVTDRASVAMSWDNMSLQPVFATPNFFDGLDDHRMTLQGRNIQAVLRCGTDSLEESIVWAVGRYGLPPLPPAPRMLAQQNEICLAALNGPLRTDEGWGHCVQEGWARQPFADTASTVWRLSGEVPAFERFVPGGAHVPNGTIYFVTGRAQEWLNAQWKQIRNHIARQQADGSYRYDGKFRRGHFENTASGVCAIPAAHLLEFAYITGDQEALQAGLRTLDYMRRFNTPRGAQVWEVPLHTPDQLASAYLVWAYTRGFQLTGNEQYLKEARKWAISGIPFTYLWGRYPVMAYATPPVYGATNWIAPNWMGLPVQWVGGVYAYALALLAPHEKTLDWNHLARGILISAQQQQYPEGAYVGLLPDSFNIPLQRRQPADINPCALVSLQRVLDGEVDFLSVASDGHRRVAAPFPVTLHDGSVHVEGQKGLTYQILVDGATILDVESQGKDEVALPPRK